MRGGACRVEGVSSVVLAMTGVACCSITGVVVSQSSRSLVRVEGYATEGDATEGYATEGYATEGYATEGYATARPFRLGSARLPNARLALRLRCRPQVRRTSHDTISLSTYRWAPGLKCASNVWSSSCDTMFGYMHRHPNTSSHTFP